MSSQNTYKRFTKQGKFSKPIHWLYKEFRKADFNKEELSQLYFNRFKHFPPQNRFIKARLNQYSPIVSKVGFESFHQLCMVVIEIELGHDFNRNKDLAAYTETQITKELEKLGYHE